MSSDSLTLFAVIPGPTTAAILSFVFSIWYQNRKQKREAQENLFRTLMMHRGVDFPPYELVNSLNLIDVIFAKRPKVVDLWHQYLDAISQKEVNWQFARFLYLDLLSEIGNFLGYESLRPSDFARFYHPQGYIQLSQLSGETQLELLRVLKNTGHFVVGRRADELSSSQEPPPSN